MLYGRSRSVKVTDFGTDRKLVHDILLVSNANLYPISHRIVAYWSNYGVWRL